MTASPCADCPRKHLSKENCAKNCARLHAVQSAQIRISEACVSNRVDYYDESGFSLLIPR